MNRLAQPYDTDHARYPQRVVWFTECSCRFNKIMQLIICINSSAILEYIYSSPHQIVLPFLQHREKFPPVTFKLVYNASSRVLKLFGVTRKSFHFCCMFLLCLKLSLKMCIGGAFICITAKENSVLLWLSKSLLQFQGRKCVAAKLRRQLWVSTFFLCNDVLCYSVLCFSLLVCYIACVYKMSGVCVL